MSERCEAMNKKGLETRKLIINKAQTLFEEKGFKEITMKDICETTGLSRGGLYCHYESTEQIFLEIINSFLNSQEYDFDSKMQDGTPAKEILNIILEKYKLEMLDSSKSLSLAIYEYFSSKGKDNEQNFLKQQYLASFSSWKKLIEYGIMRGEFNSVDVQTIFDFIIFSYQGIRMYSKLMDIDEGIPNRIIGQIKSLLLIETEKSK